MYHIKTANTQISCKKGKLDKNPAGISEFFSITANMIKCESMKELIIRKKITMSGDKIK